MTDIHLTAILLAALLAVASPGPATLAIAGTAMQRGRGPALALAMGIMTGSLFWSVTAALGLGALMLANAWVLEVIRYVGVAYLLYLAFKSARSAMRPGTLSATSFAGNGHRLYLKGLMLHLTNPKAILFFGALYSIGVPADTPLAGLALVIGAVAAQSFVIFTGYSCLFSLPAVHRTYLRMRRTFEAVFALGFGAVGLRLLAARLT